MGREALTTIVLLALQGIHKTTPLTFQVQDDGLAIHGPVRNVNARGIADNAVARGGVILPNWASGVNANQVAACPVQIMDSKIRRPVTEAYMDEFKEHGNFTPKFIKSHIVTKFSGASLEQFSDCSQQLQENSPTYDNSALYAKLEHAALSQELYARTGHNAVYVTGLNPPAEGVQAPAVIPWRGTRLRSRYRTCRVIYFALLQLSF